MNLEVLIPAVLTCLRDNSGYATKTKLLKLLYLLDVESFREKKETLTGFDWIFYKYGPWTANYDEVLEHLEAAGKIRMTNSDNADLEATFVNAVDVVKLSAAFPTIKDELKARRIIGAWAERRTGELLDYVYFHTAPMRDARISRTFFVSIGRKCPMSC